MMHRSRSLLIGWAVCAAVLFTTAPGTAVAQSQDVISTIMTTDWYQKAVPRVIRVDDATFVAVVAMGSADYYGNYVQFRSFLSTDGGSSWAERSTVDLSHQANITQAWYDAPSGRVYIFGVERKSEYWPAYGEWTYVHRGYLRYSTNYGSSWSSPVYIGAPEAIGTYPRSAGPSRFAMDGRDIAIVFQTYEYGQRRAAVSTDGGQSWIAHSLTGFSSCSYPSPVGSVKLGSQWLFYEACTYYGDWDDTQTVKMTSWSPAGGWSEPVATNLSFVQHLEAQDGKLFALRRASWSSGIYVGEDGVQWSYSATDPINIYPDRVAVQTSTSAIIEIGSSQYRKIYLDTRQISPWVSLALRAVGDRPERYHTDDLISTRVTGGFYEPKTVQFYRMNPLNRPPVATVDSVWANNMTPTLAWSRSDPDAGDSQTMYQVQIETQDGGALYDSGVVSSSASGHAVSGVFAAEGLYRYRVRLWDSHYNRSDFSQFAQIGIDQTPPSGGLSINGGTVHASSASVTLSLPATDNLSGVSQMRVRNAGSAWGGWQAFSSTLAWTLSSPSIDGEKTVEVQYRDAAGNLSEVYGASVMLDTVPPVGSLTANNGQPYTTVSTVTLTHTASDNLSGVSHVRVRNGGASWGSWGDYSSTRSWSLPGGDGAKTVEVQFRDAAGNLSEVYAATIAVDTTPPEGTLDINGGAEATNVNTVSLTIRATDVTSSVHQMRFSSNGSTWSSWETYNTNRSFTVSGGNGTRTVWAQLRDKAGNSSAPFSAAITVDTAAPTGSISINGGVPYTASAPVNLGLAATDNLSGVAHMRLSTNGATWSEWEPHVPDREFALPEGDGSKTVWAQFRDRAGNVSGSYSASIVLDTTPPDGTVTMVGGAEFTTTATVQLATAASDAGSGVDKMRIGSDGGVTWAAWENYATSRSVSLAGGDGVRAVAVQYRDRAGNASPTVSDLITLDTTPPTGAVVIAGGASYTKDVTVDLTLSARDQTSGVDRMRISTNGGATWGAWIPYATSASVVLPGGDGSKAVGVQFRDAAGNVSQAYSDTITLDSTPPTGAIGVPAVSSGSSVPVSLSASDAGSAVSGFSVRVNDGTWSAWQSMVDATQAVVPGAGEYTIAVRYRDTAGNISSVHSGNVVVTLTSVPSVTLLINGAAEKTAAADVRLSIQAADSATGPSGLQMRFSNDGANWSPWEAYAPRKSWALAGTAGLNTVHVQVRNAAGSIGSTTAGIVSTTGTGRPGLVVTTAELPSTYQGRAIYATAATDVSLNLAAIGASEVRVRTGNSAWSEWTPFADEVLVDLVPVEGVHRVDVQVRDELGAISDTQTLRFLVDRTPPDVELTWANGATATRTGSATLVVTASDNLTAPDGLKVESSIDGGVTWNTMPGPTAVILVGTGGRKTVHVRVTDEAGNVATRSISIWSLAP